ncbi:MAG TPA: hypothetical protein VL652_34645 [Kutzneria sp.]|jgi:hypothetical protein|nr:hypothetical protein [Kutzneria sp.]
MTALATPDQLASRLQKDLDTSSAQLAVDGASGLIRAISAQVFTFVSQETVVLTGNERVLTLPQRPLVVDDSNPLTITEMAEFGGVAVLMVEDRDYSRVGNQLTRGFPWWWNTGGRLMGYPRTRPLGVWAPRVQVTYSHGYTTIPDDVVSVVLDAASVLYDNPTGIRAYSIDDYSETKAAEVLGAAMVQSIADKLGVAGRRRRAFSIRTTI